MIKTAFILYFLLTPFGNAISINSKKTSVPILISVTIKDIKTPKGQILMGIYKDDVSFDKEIPYKKVQSFKTKISNGTLILDVKLEPGKAAIVIFFVYILLILFSMPIVFFSVPLGYAFHLAFEGKFGKNLNF